ncbi:MAG: FHA domain-containing protein [Planctomycetes bacterium]|nr:FHA domain-containing protein [Planctomycetota bacterium]
MSANVPYLELDNGSMKGTQFRLMGEMISIGRTPDCDIVLEEAKGVSRKHAQISIIDGRIRVRDLESQNGTIVDGKKIKDAVISNGCKLKIGDAVLTLVVPGSAPVPAGQGGNDLRRASSRRVAKQPGSVPAAASEQSIEPYLQPAELSIANATIEESEKSARFLLKILLLVAILGGGLYFVTVLLAVPPVQRGQQEIMEKGEERVVMIRTPFHSAEVRGSSDTGAIIAKVMPYGDDPVRHLLKGEIEQTNTDNSQRGYPVLHFLVVNAEARGNGQIVLLDRGGKPIRSIELIVRGLSIKDRWIDEYDPNTAYDEAKRLMQDGIRLRKDGKLYEALTQLEKADLLAKTRAKSSSDFNEISNYMRDIRMDLRKRLAEKFKEAMSDAFPPRDAPTGNHFRSAYITLDDAKQLVPDRASLEWQILDYWQAELRRLSR